MPVVGVPPGTVIAGIRESAAGSLPSAEAATLEGRCYIPPNPKSDAGRGERASAFDVLERRPNLVRILFVHRSVAAVERCLHEVPTHACQFTIGQRRDAESCARAVTA